MFGVLVFCLVDRFDYVGIYLGIFSNNSSGSVSGSIIVDDSIEQKPLYYHAIRKQSILRCLLKGLLSMYGLFFFENFQKSLFLDFFPFFAYLWKNFQLHLRGDDRHSS